MANLHTWVVALSLLGLTACAASGVVVNHRHLGPYSLADRNYAASRGLATEIVGNPFDAPQSDLRRVVTDTIRTSHFGQPFRMLSDADEDARSPYRVVLAFGGRSRYDICATRRAEPAADTVPVNGRIDVSAAFCARDQLLTSTRGHAAGVTGPDDPRFRRLVSQIGFELFPPFDDNIGDDQGDFTL